MSKFYHSGSNAVDKAEEKQQHKRKEKFIIFDINTGIILLIENLV